MQTEHVIQHRPGRVVLYKTERKCHLIDIAVPVYKSVTLLILLCVGTKGL